MADPSKTMFEIYREGDYNRKFRSIFYTELEEHARDGEIARAANGETVFTGFVHDETKEDARRVVDEILEQLNDMDEDVAGISEAEVARRLGPFLAE